MSERELRWAIGWMKELRDDRVGKYTTLWTSIDDAVDEALAKEPDVVAIAKELRRAMNWAKKVESAGRDEVDPAVRTVGQVSALEDERLLDWLQKTFGFRLTEGGWEWIEGER